jgi:four helix bundle protein
MKNFENNIIYNKSFDFALQIIELYKFLSFTKKEYVISKQLLRSGTSIGANVSESLSAQSRKDFISKMHIALKEATETRYWITLLIKSQFINEVYASNLLNNLQEIIKIINTIINTSKENLTQKKA